MRLLMVWFSLFPAILVAQFECSQIEQIPQIGRGGTPSANRVPWPPCLEDKRRTEVPSLYLLSRFIETDRLYGEVSYSNSKILPTDIKSATIVGPQVQDDQVKGLIQLELISFDKKPFNSKKMKGWEIRYSVTLVDFITGGGQVVVRDKIADFKELNKFEFSEAKLEFNQNKVNFSFAQPLLPPSNEREIAQMRFHLRLTVHVKVDNNEPQELPFVTILATSTPGRMELSIVD